MKANELMIGDWVLIDAPDRYAGAHGTICSLMHHHSDDGAYFYVFVQDKGVLLREVFNEDLRPIPLTKDILEKNGLNTKDLPTHFKEDENFDLELWINDAGAICWSINVAEYVVLQLQFVHELQHALRLCGIDKEIVL